MKYYVINIIRLFKNFIIVVFTINNWWLYYLDYIGMVKKPSMIFRLRNKKIFYATPGQDDGVIISEIWGNNVYENPPLKIDKDDTVVDIGAHKGYFATYASAKASKGNVYAFEPIPNNFALLKKNISVNRCKNVYVYSFGIAKKKGKIYLYENPNNSSGFTLVKEAFKDFSVTVKSTSIKVISLKDVFTRCKIKKIDFLKMDCEGAEFEILLNTPSYLFNKINKISMEYHQLHTFRIKTLINFLKKNGYNIKTDSSQGVIGMLYAHRIHT
jgi:FkbM family methyltransferase